MLYLDNAESNIHFLKNFKILKFWNPILTFIRHFGRYMRFNFFNFGFFVRYSALFSVTVHFSFQTKQSFTCTRGVLLYEIKNHEF